LGNGLQRSGTASEDDDVRSLCCVARGDRGPDSGAVAGDDDDVTVDL
jgi:hypothetical protein